MGGELVNGTAPSATGDSRGDSIRGGVTQVLKAGDVVFVPPGVPHHFSQTDPNGVTEILVRWDIK